MGTPIKKMQLGGECRITAVFEDGTEESWYFEENDGIVTYTDDDDNEITTEEELRERGVDHIIFSDTYTIWDTNPKKKNYLP